MFRVAHFSDLHLNHRNSAEKTSSFEKTLQHAIKQKVDHIVISGDISDDADEEDFQVVRDVLNRNGLLSAKKISIVPGNHDLWGNPDPRDGKLGRVVKTLFSNHYHDKRSLFFEMFAETFNGDFLFPVLKRLGDVAFMLMNSVEQGATSMTVSASLGESQLGHISEWMNCSARLKIIIMHHHLCDRFSDGTEIGVRIGPLPVRFGFTAEEKQKFLWSWNDQTVYVLHGHIHDPFQYTLNNGTILSGPSGPDSYCVYEFDGDQLVKRERVVV